MLRYIIIAPLIFFETLITTIMRMLRRSQPTIVIPYGGHGYERIIIRGRIIHANARRVIGPDDGRTLTVLKTLQAFFPIQAKHMPITITYQGHEYHTRTDHEGYYQSILSADRKKPHPETITVNETHDSVLLSSAHARFGVISDIDDTIIKTETQKPFSMFKNTLTNYARRTIFPSVKPFYDHLHTYEGRNPFFYISASPWNLYPMISRFLAYHALPEGAIILTDYTMRSIGKDKYARIKEVLLLHPHIDFILIGDTGERDPITYSEIAHDHPDRIIAIILRNVGRIEKVPTSPVPTYIVKDFARARDKLTSLFLKR